MKAEIITIGNEVLLGDVHDTNSHFLARELTFLGVPVIRMYTIRDTRDEIVKFLDYAVRHDGVDIVVTTGGLGPTADDMTYEAVADWMGVELREDRRALLYLEERVELLNFIDTSRVRTLTPSRRKMALIPQGGIPLYNPQGAAPGLWVEMGGQVLLCLPGVPQEMSSIWEVEARPRLKEFTRGYSYEVRHFLVHHSDESALAPIVADAAGKYTEIHFKTRPKRVGKGWEMKLDIAQFVSDATPSRIEEAVEYLTNAIRNAGIKIELRGDE